MSGQRSQDIQSRCSIQKMIGSRPQGKRIKTLIIMSLRLVQVGTWERELHNRDRQ